MSYLQQETRRRGMTHNTQHTTHNTQHTTHNTQHTTHNTQHTTHNTQHTTHNTQQHSHDLPHVCPRHNTRDGREKDSKDRKKSV
jgi:hypothetical protein